MRRFLAAIAVLLMGAAVCAQDAPRVGVITSLTGRFAEFGEQHTAGIEVALEEVNANGGVNGQPLEVIIRDDTSEVTVALSEAEQLLAQGVPLVMGAYSSSITNPLGQYFTRQERPFLAFTSSDDAITKPGSDWVYRLNQPGAAYAEVLFNIFDEVNAREEGAIRTIALLHGNGNFETAVATAAQRLADERGYEIVETESYDRGVTDFRPVLNRFAQRSPDAVFMVSYAEDSVGIMRQISEVGLDAKIYAGGAAGFALPGFITGAGEAAEHVVTATAWTDALPYEGVPELFDRLTEALGGVAPSYHAAQAYAAIITAADVLRRAGDESAEAIRQALDETDLMTTYGPIRFDDFDGYRNQNPLDMVAQQVQDGEFITVYVSPDVEPPAELVFPAPAWSER